MNQFPKRLKSIDVFRALTMLLMIFVNDADELQHIPAWIKHVAASEDGLGFADTVFPAFLFIVGLSLPFAIKNRLNKGGTFFSVALYIMLRSLALLVMGFFHVNAESYSTAALLPRPAWVILTTIAFFLIWLDYPATLSKLKRYALVTIGILLLALMAFLYKGGDDPATPAGMSPHWWGILGIIGWSYLVAALAFLLTKGRLPLLAALLVVFTAINLLKHMNLADMNIPVIGDGSAVSLVMWGVVISMIYERIAGRPGAQRLWTVLTTIAIVLIAAGLLVRSYAGGISKIHSTPAWVFICTGISILVFESMIWLVDVKGRKDLFKWISPAGTSTLTCYLLPYILYALFSLFHFHYPAIFSQGAGGLLRSFAVALFIILVTGLLEKRSIRLKI